MTTLASSLSFLPEELVLRILDIIASSDRKNCLALCLVSSWTRRIALPHLFHTVIITERNCTAFREGVANTRRTSYVKRLWVATENRSAGFVLTSCKFITALVASQFLIDLLDGCLPFQSLTHLCITHYSLSHADFTKRLFPQLTHFAVSVYSAQDCDVHREMLKVYGAQLVMVVARLRDVRNEDAVEWVREVWKVEKRMYLTSMGIFSLEQDWMPGARDSAWDRARRETRGVLGLGASDDA